MWSVLVCLNCKPLKYYQNEKTNFTFTHTLLGSCVKKEDTENRKERNCPDE
jgi:hypothetical protein